MGGPASGQGMSGNAWGGMANVSKVQVVQLFSCLAAATVLDLCVLKLA